MPQLESDEDLITVTTSAQRSALLTKLDEVSALPCLLPLCSPGMEVRACVSLQAEEWLYSDGEAAEVQELRSRLADLKDLSQPMSQR